MAKKEKNEFSAARKKRRFKIAMLRTKKFIGAVLALAIVCVAVWLFVKEDVAGIIGDRIAASSSSGASMPVEIAGTAVKETFTIGDNVGVLTDGNVALYAKNGKQLLSYTHGMTDPIVKAAGRRFLLYDRGGTKLVVRMRDKVLFEKEFDYKIISANISSGGWITVVTAAQRYASQLHVWNSAYDEEIFTWSSSGEYIICSAADSGSKTVAAATLTANASGQMVTTVHIFTTEAAIELGKKDFSGEAAVSLEYNSSGNVKIICDSMAAVVDRSGNVIGRYDFDRKLISCVNVHGTSGMALVFDRYTEARATDVTFIGSRGEQVKTVSVSGKFLCANGNSSHAAVYCDGTATVFDYSGNKTAELTSEQDALLILLTKESVFAVTRDEICEVKK